MIARHDRDRELQSVLEQAVVCGIPGLTVAVATRDGVIWESPIGYSDLASRTPMTLDMLLGIGSISKTLVAVAILQLVEEGQLRLEDTVGSLLGRAADGIANSECASIADLLSHTSGIPSWEDDPRWIREARGDGLRSEHQWDKLEALSYVRGKPAMRAAGHLYSYSNSNYTLLGLILEKLVPGVTAIDTIRQRICRPLGLNDFYLEGFEPVPEKRLPRRYHVASESFLRNAGVHITFAEVRPGLIDVTQSNLSNEWVAGGMIATARDLALFGVALRDGRLLRSDGMSLLTRWSPAKVGALVGLGVFRFEGPNGTKLIGHDGGVLGFSGTLFWVVDSDAVVASICNLGTVHAGQEGNPLIATLKSDRFVTAVLGLLSETT